MIHVYVTFLLSGDQPRDVPPVWPDPLLVLLLQHEREQQHGAGRLPTPVLVSGVPAQAPVRCRLQRGAPLPQAAGSSAGH